MLPLPRQAAALVPLHPAAAAQAEGRPGALLQRPDHRAGEDVRDPEVPVPPGEEAPGQGAAAERETGGFFIHPAHLILDFSMILLHI